ALVALPAPARRLVELLAHVEEDERRAWFVREVWPEVWRESAGLDAPPLESALEPLVAAVMVEVEGDDPARHAYRLHPGVGEAIRAATDPAFGQLVDDLVIGHLTAAYEHAHREEAQGRSGEAIVRAGLAATPYLLRSGRHAQAVDVLETATDRDLAPGTTNRAMNYLRRLLDGDPDVLERPAVTALHAKLLSRNDPLAALREFLALATSGSEAGRFDLVSLATSECARILLDHDDLEDALRMARAVPGYSDLAGYGPWTRAADTCLELIVLTKMGRHHEAAARAVELVDEADGLADDSGEPERVTPVSTRGVVLSTALEAVTRFGDWDVALGLCERIDALHARRGATDHERARLRLNTAVVLLGLDRVAEAEDVLRHSQSVFEDADDTVLLGEVFRLRAEVRQALGRPDDALTMAQAALRYSYESINPAVLAEGHDRVASYLASTGAHGRVCAAHRAAAAVLRAATSHAERGNTVVELSDLLEHGPDLFPRTLDEMVATVEQVPGVRLGDVLDLLVPDGHERAELFDEVVSVPRENLRIGADVLADHREQRDLLQAAVDRDVDGGLDPVLLGDLDDASLEIFAAIRALRHGEAKRRLRATRPPGEPRLFGAQVVPSMGDHRGGIRFTGFAETRTEAFCGVPMTRSAL
ncbi:tetratricopeptide repeat protein, partial [Actinosynnema sp. NPDC023658]|uniref:tetratricopeptide repeat protein n=1 Tax=Actinosynnema sp. NPDC023658 TaxID=3155465 RepID=UPI0033E881A1